MSAIAYSVAIALVGASAAVTSKVVVSIDTPVEKRVEIPATPTSVPAYDFAKFSADVVSPIGTESVSGKTAITVERLKPVRVAAVDQSQLNMIVRDTALAEKANSLAAAADTQSPEISAVDDEDFVVTGEEVSVPFVENPAIVPVPKARPSYSALQTQPAAKRRTVRRTKRSLRAKRSLRRPVRVAEASTRQSRLARRLRSKGWLIGAFR